MAALARATDRRSMPGQDPVLRKVKQVEIKARILADDLLLGTYRSSFLWWTPVKVLLESPLSGILIVGGDKMPETPPDELCEEPAGVRRPDKTHVFGRADKC
jgi:hypothetical protein